MGFLVSKKKKEVKRVYLDTERTNEADIFDSYMTTLALLSTISMSFVRLLICQFYISRLTERAKTNHLSNDINIRRNKYRHTK